MRLSMRQKKDDNRLCKNFWEIVKNVLLSTKDRLGKMKINICPNITLFFVSIYIILSQISIYVVWFSSFIQVTLWSWMRHSKKSDIVYCRDRLWLEDKISSNILYFKLILNEQNIHRYFISNFKCKIYYNLWQIHRSYGKYK